MIEKCLTSPGSAVSTANNSPLPKNIEPDVFASSFVRIDVVDARPGSCGPAAFVSEPTKRDISKSLGFSFQGLTTVAKRNLKIGAAVWGTAMILGLSLGCTLLPKSWPPDNSKSGPSPAGTFGILYGILVGVGGVAAMVSYAHAAPRST